MHVKNLILAAGLFAASTLPAQAQDIGPIPIAGRVMGVQASAASCEQLAPSNV